MIWCFCVHDALFEGYACSIQSKQREKLQYRSLVDFSYSFYVFVFLFPFLLFSRPGKDDDVYKSRSIGKLTTQNL